MTKLSSRVFSQPTTVPSDRESGRAQKCLLTGTTNNRLLDIRTISFHTGKKLDQVFICSRRSPIPDSVVNLAFFCAIASRQRLT